MTFFCTLSGAIFLTFTSIIGIVLLVEYVKDKNHNREKRLMEDIRKLAIKEIGERIESECYWFSEDYSAQMAAKCIGANIRSGSYDVDYARSRWREYMKIKKDSIE